MTEIDIFRPKMTRIALFDQNDLKSHVLTQNAIKLKWPCFTPKIRHFKKTTLYKNKIKFLQQEIDGKEKNKTEEVKDKARLLLNKEVRECFKLIREFDEKYKGITFVNKDLVQQVLKAKIRELKACFDDEKWPN